MPTCYLNPYWLAEIGAHVVPDRFAVYIKAYDRINKRAELCGSHRTLKAAHRTLASAIRKHSRGAYHAAFIIGPDGTQYNWTDSKRA